MPTAAHRKPMIEKRLTLKISMGCLLSNRVDLHIDRYEVPIFLKEFDKLGLKGIGKSHNEWGWVSLIL